MSAMLDPGEIADAIRCDGYVVVRDLIAPRDLREIREQLAPWLQGRHYGRNDFEGLRSERVYALLAKAPAIAKIVEHPTVLAVLDRLLRPHYRLSACLAIQVHPGETAQGWHTDDGYVALPRPREMVGVSTIWAFDDFTDENGATEVIPGSHRWGDGDVPAADDARAVQVVMPAGSAVRHHAAVLRAVGAPDREHGARSAARRGAQLLRARPGAGRLRHPRAVHRLRRRRAPEAAAALGERAHSM